MQEVIKTGKTVDEAIEQACAELGVSRDDINLSVEVIEMPQTKLFRSTPAKVRVSIDEDMLSVKDLIAGIDEKKPEPAPQPAAAAEQPKQAKPEQQQQQKPQSQQKQKPQPAPIELPERKESDKIELSALPPGASAAFAYLSEVAEKMGLTQLEYAAYATEGGGVEFVVGGDEAPALIGRRGETMDALQYLSLLVSNRAADGEYCKITLDIAGYRQKRAKTLESLAHRMAAKVKKGRRSQALEPMNPYERRIVHSAIQSIDGVKSESIGEEPRRRVVVSLEGDNRPYQSRSGGGNRGSNRSGNRGGNRGSSGGNRYDRPRGDSRSYDDRPRSQPQKQSEPDPEAEKNLYKKIEF